MDTKAIKRVNQMRIAIVFPEVIKIKMGEKIKQTEKQTNL